jgi:membrane-associated phospholipid phosphatase
MAPPMPPLYQDPLSAVPGAEWHWLDLARALAEVSCEAWALALVALAVYSFLEDDVKGVLKAFLPLALALAAAAVVALGARALGGAPRPLEGAGHALGPLLRRAFPTSQAAAVVVFAVYTALAYGRRALPAVVVAVLVGIARALGAPHWAADLTGGAVAGGVLAAAAYLLTLRLLPRGHLARLREQRRHGDPAPAGRGSA